MKITVNTCYVLNLSDDIDIEGVNNLDDIKSWFVKWHTLHYTLDGDNWLEVDLSLDYELDTKRPDAASIHKAYVGENE
jgi:hypothetical protein